MDTDSLHMIALDERHLRGALALSVEAYWNQTCEDWKMMMAAGNAFGMIAPDGRLVGTALALPYGETFGWISMVLVATSWRKQGLATKLLGRAIEVLESDRLIPVLDATPAGENVYRTLGFVSHFLTKRWKHGDASVFRANAPTKPLSSLIDKSGTNALKIYDQGVFGGDRETVLDAILARSGEHARIANKQRGYLLTRNGRQARQIGPICADETEIAIEMLDQALTGMTGPVFIDACDHQPELGDHLQELGFKQQRPFLRMAKGHKAPFGDPGRMFALAGPELG